VAKVHQRGNFHALVSRREAKIVDRIVRNGERMKVDLADAKVAARFYLFDAVAERASPFPGLFIVYVEALADVSIAGFGGDVDRAIDCPQQHTQAARMVAVFMGDENGVESLHVFANKREPARDLFGAKSSVNENTRLACNDQNRIAS
jgi:hypothetical protein